MRKLAVVVLTFIATALLGLAAAPSALAATPSDKPVVTIGVPSVTSSGGVSPDTWHTDVVMPVGGYGFTRAGNVYVTVQDISSGQSALPGRWIVAGAGVCGPECNNTGRISTTLSYTDGYRAVCDDTLRVWAWDQTKSPQAGYGWSYRDTVIHC